MNFYFLYYNYLLETPGIQGVGLHVILNLILDLTNHHHHRHLNPFSYQDEVNYGVRFRERFNMDHFFYN